MHVSHFVEGENPVDDRFERAGFQPVDHELDRRLTARLVPTCQPDIVRLDSNDLGDHLENWQRGHACA